LGFYYDMRDGQSDISKFLDANAAYAKETAEQEKERLQTALSTAQAFLQQKDITAEESENLKLVVNGLNEALAAMEPETQPSEIEQFIAANAGYAKETAEQEKERLAAALATAEAYLVQADLTDEQRKNIEKIVYGLKQIQEQNGGGEQTPKEKVDEIWNSLFSDSVSDWASSASEYIDAVVSTVQDKMGVMGDVVSNFYDTMIQAQEDAANAQIKIIEKQITAEKKLYEKQTKLIQSQYDNRTKSLADQYAWGLITYEDYITGQMVLDDEKAAQEDAAASRYKQLEQDKLDIQNRVGKTNFENQKKQSIAQALILGAQAVLQGYASLGLIGGTVAAVAMGGITAAQIATISGQQYTPTTALADGGIAYKPVAAMIGEGGEPEAVVPLSKAEQFGFSGNHVVSQDTNIYLMGPVYSFDQLAEAVAAGIARGQRTGRIPRWEEAV